MKKPTLVNDFVWNAACFISIAIFTVAMSQVFAYPWSAPLSLREPLCFTVKQLDYALETAKTLLPICAGYVLFAAPALKYLRGQRQLRRSNVRVGVAMVFLFGIAAIGLWAGAIAFLINCANAFEQSGGDYQAVGSLALHNKNWLSALLCAKIAYLLFFASIVWFAAAAVDILFPPPDEPANGSDASGDF